MEKVLKDHFQISRKCEIMTLVQMETENTLENLLKSLMNKLEVCYS